MLNKSEIEELEVNYSQKDFI